MDSLEDLWQQFGLWEDGSFTILSADLEDFTHFLEGHGVVCDPPEVDAIGCYSIGRIRSPFDGDCIKQLHRSWITDRRAKRREESCAQSEARSTDSAASRNSTVADR
jgi:hypothetical protein